MRGPSGTRAIGHSSAILALCAAILVFLVFFGMFWVGGMGGGDVKLGSAFGLWFAPLATLKFFVATSLGFRTRLKLSFGPPLPVGQSSLAEYLAVEFARPPEVGNPLVGSGALVITPNAGLRAVETAVTMDALRAFATVDISNALRREES